LPGSDAFARWVLDHRRLVAALLLGLTLASVAGIFDPIRGVPRIRVDPSLNEMLPEGDSARLFYEELVERFGSDDVVLVVLRSTELFTPAGLETLVRATHALEAAPGVHHVEGLANALRLRAVDDDLDISGFLETLPTTPEEADRLRVDVLADPLRAGSFVSHDGSATGILVTFQRIPEDRFLAQNLDLGLLAVARAAAPDMKVILAGTPHIKAEVGRLMTSEIARMVPLVFLLMGALSCAFFRSVRLGLVPIAGVALGLVWTVGLMGWVGHDLNIVTTLIPPLVLALGFAYSTHVVASFRADAEAGEYDPADTGRLRTERALSRVAFPVTFTALTTAVGFLSLATNGLEVIRGFGVFAAVSTGATLLAALTLAPLLLLGSKSQASKTSPSTASVSGRLDRFFEALATFDVRHANSILVGVALLILVGIWGATRIEVNLPVIENFPPDARIRLAYQEVDELFGGANQFYVMLRAEEPGDFERPEWLREVASLQDWLVEQPEIGGTTSVVQYLEVLNEALGEGESPKRTLPSTADGVAQLLLFGGNEELDVLIDRAHQVITILVRSTETETREFDLLARRIDARLAELPAGISGHTTGNAILLTRAADRISRGQALSLVWACGMIGLLLIAYFRSPRLGLFALVPNIVPVVLYFGLLGLTGTTLNNSTALMGSIVLGIAVDDTLHLLVEYRRGLRTHGDPEAALREALVHVGRAITCTTMAVCIGLLVVGASELRNQAEFGILGAVTLAIAWLVDVTFTPALCSRLIRQA
jgi:predicted RND superfamily exporter protein